MKNKIILFSLIIISLLFIILLINLLENKKFEKICIENKKCFNIEIADTPKSMSKGLSEKNSLDNNKGMLFVFEKNSKISFWMKDMKFSLDLIGINKNNKIIKIEKNILPCKENCKLIVFDNETKYVLEINAGLSNKYDLKKGDLIKLKESN